MIPGDLVRVYHNGWRVGRVEGVLSRGAKKGSLRVCVERLAKGKRGAWGWRGVVIVVDPARAERVRQGRSRIVKAGGFRRL